MSMMSSADENSGPLIPPDSPGSSVSTRMEEEYEELLKYAVVVPTINAEQLPKTLTDLRQSFPQSETARKTVDRQIEVLTHEHEESKQDEPESGHAVDDSEEVQSVSDVPEPPAAGNSSTPNLVRTQRRIQVETVRETARMNTEQFGDRPDTPDTTTSTISALGLGKSPDDQGAYPQTVDPDIARMESLMDQWTYELKRNVLAEFSQSKIQMLEQHRQQLLREKERHAVEVTRVQNEVESMKELLLTYEKSIERKDQVINNLTNGLQKQREKHEMLKTFCDWKLRHNEQKREAFAMKLAERHYSRSLTQKVWAGWHSVIENKWRLRVEKACQAKAQEVCMSLTNDYETKLASLNEALEAARVEVVRLHEERDRYEETMKKAFMRGVCALNMEAMSMFHDAETKERTEGRATVEQTRDHVSSTEQYGGYTSDADLHSAYTVQQEAVYATEPPGAPPPRVVTSQASTSRGFCMQGASITAGSGVSGRSSKPKVIKAKVTARSDTNVGSIGPTTLAPPMSSVMVERHQPVVKQTIGHATASKYPKSGQSGIIHRKIAGQSGSIPIATPNIQTIKVVE